MSRYQHILATTDLSPESFAAVSHAAHLAAEFGGKLTILHVPHSTSVLFTDFAPPIDMVDVDKQIRDAAGKTLQGWVSRHIDAAVDVSLLLREGVTHEVVSDAALEVGADLIVMATHGRSGLAHVVLGSVTERVLRDAPCPVLVVRPPAEAAQGKKGSKPS